MTDTQIMQEPQNISKIDQLKCVRGTASLVQCWNFTMWRGMVCQHLYLDTLGIKLQNCNRITSGGQKQSILSLAISHEENGSCPDIVVMFSAFIWRSQSISQVSGSQCFLHLTTRLYCLPALTGFQLLSPLWSYGYLHLKRELKSWCTFLWCSCTELNCEECTISFHLFTCVNLRSCDWEEQILRKYWLFNSKNL